MYERKCILRMTSYNFNELLKTLRRIFQSKTHIYLIQSVFSTSFSLFENIVPEIWNLSDILFKLLSFSYLSWYKRDMPSQRLRSSLHVAINSSLRPIFFYFTNALMLRNIENFSKKVLFFFYVKLSLLIFLFIKK